MNVALPASGKTEAFITGPASPFCQRWNDRTHSWRHTSEGGFDARQFEVAAIDQQLAIEFCVRHHYAGKAGGMLANYGLYSGAALVGVACLTNGGFKTVLTNAFPELEAYTESAELGRLVLLDEVPANAESWFLAEAFRQAAAQGMRGIVSFSDPLQRTAADGRLVMPGHIGTIYQASNARYTGQATPRTLHLLPNGHVFNAQDMQKIREQKQGHEYAERTLCSFGARPMRPRENPTRWLAGALEKVGTRRVRHPGNHRYLFALGDRRQRRSVSLGFRQLPYPKANA